MTFNRSFKERSPSAQWTFRKMILSLGARFGARPEWHLVKHLIFMG